MVVDYLSKNVAMVLVRPRFPENIGSAARAMCNMGFYNLIVVAPENPDKDRIFKLSTHAAAGVVEQMAVFDSLETALAPFNLVVGTTARLGRQRSVIGSPEKLAQKLVPLATENRVAVLFGPEDRGLSNADIRFCHWLMNIPTAKFASLNLAQAVMIVCYALFNSVQAPTQKSVPRLASRQELDGMYAKLSEILVRIDYIKADNADYWMNRVRHFGTRMQLQARDVNIIRGICRQINWYGNKRYQDGNDKKGA
jgi:tRNA/rRNA methyltransferase